MGGFTGGIARNPVFTGKFTAVPALLQCPVSPQVNRGISRSRRDLAVPLAES